MKGIEGAEMYYSEDLIEKVRSSNDIVDVADGYARNYLIPNSIATFASESAIKMAKENLRQGEKK